MLNTGEHRYPCQGRSVRISELSRTTGVSVPTIKFYLREGLLAPGRATSATQAQYDETHVARLRLVRALVDVAGLPLASVRSVTAAVDDPPAVHDLLGVAHDALPPRVGDDVDVARAREVVDALGWQVFDASTAMRQLARALDALDALGLLADVGTIVRYGRAVEPVAAAEVAEVPTTSPADAVTFVVAGTALYEPVLLALRRLAQQHASAARFGGGA